MRKIESLKEIREIELNILEYFDRFCKENKLEYFLAYGTLIGAIRHKGFIPWDDDIDVWMPREEYDRFIKIHKNGEYILMCPEKSKRNTYTYAWSKLVDSNTKLIEEFQPKIEMGVHIDIFPIDYLGSKNKYKKNVSILNERYKRINYLDTANGFKGIILKAIGRKNLSKIYKIINRNNKNNSEYVSNVVDVNDNPFIYKKEWFDKKDYCRFENKEYCIPKNYDEILKAQYGDYMELPSEEERNPHHEFAAWVKK